jgi:uncharacterized FlaG/YvyC family protein
MAQSEHINPIEASRSLLDSDNPAMQAMLRWYQSSHYPSVKDKQPGEKDEVEPLSRGELESLVSKMNENSDKPPHLKFSVDDTTGRTVITVTHAETKEVLRQIPSEEILAVAKMVREANDTSERQPGMLLEARA